LSLATSADVGQGDAVRASEFTQLLYDIRSGVAWVTLNRPHKKNAMTPALYNELKWAVRLATLDPAVDLIVITGAGDAFCAGGDLTEALGRLEAGDIAALYEFADNAPFFEIRDSPKTVIAAINGDCHAGGVVIAMYCDLSIATAGAVFSLSEARVGLADPFTPTVLFGRTPTPQIKRLLFTGCRIDAEEAMRFGLVGEVVPDQDFAGRVDALIREVRSTSPVARAVYKRSINELSPRPMGNGGVDIHQSDAAREGLRAFAEKRDPRYTSDDGGT
jgi:enoyl-CoA hydratase/carnithine racemase